MASLEGIPESLEKAAKARELVSDIDKLQGYLNSVHPPKHNEKVDARLSGIRHMAFVYKTELLAEMKGWDGLLATVQAVNAESASITTLEAIADILVLSTDIAVRMLNISSGRTRLARFLVRSTTSVDCALMLLGAVFACLEVASDRIQKLVTDTAQAILSATSQRGSLSVHKFSRWLRAVCIILLSRGRSADRNKALAYMHQAVEVLKEHGSFHSSIAESVRGYANILITSLIYYQQYPMDERNWLITAAFNTGVECAS